MGSTGLPEVEPSQGLFEAEGEGGVKVMLGI